jgi:hypothetical protein
MRALLYLAMDLVSNEAQIKPDLLLFLLFELDNFCRVESKTWRISCPRKSHQKLQLAFPLDCGPFACE